MHSGHFSKQTEQPHALLPLDTPLMELYFIEHSSRYFNRTINKIQQRTNLLHQHLIVDNTIQPVHHQLRREPLLITALELIHNVMMGCTTTPTMDNTTLLHNSYHLLYTAL